MVLWSVFSLRYITLSGLICNMYVNDKFGWTHVTLILVGDKFVLMCVFFFFLVFLQSNPTFFHACDISEPVW